MPYHIAWNIEKHILEAKFWGELTEEEMHDMSNTASELLPIGESPLYFIIDMHEVIKIPLNFNDLINDVASYRSMPRLPDGILVVSNNTLLRFFSTLVSKVMTVPLTSFKSRAEVDQYMIRHPELGPLFPGRD